MEFHPGCIQMQTHEYGNGLQVEVVKSEKELFGLFADAVLSLDPDIILGWEVQQGSLGYLVDRSALEDIPLLRNISRTPEVSNSTLARNPTFAFSHSQLLSVLGNVSQQESTEGDSFDWGKEGRS